MANYEVQLKSGSNNIYPITALRNIANNSDLDDFVDPGVYGCASGAVAATLVHTPITTVGFGMMVFQNSSGSQNKEQVIMTGAHIFIRNKTSSGWGAWSHFLGYNMTSTTFTISGTNQLAASWASTTSLRFTIPVPFDVMNLYNTVALTGGAYIRTDGSQGTYQEFSNYGAVTCGLTHNGVDVNVVFNSAPSTAKTNHPCIVQPYNMKLVFSNT